MSRYNKQNEVEGYKGNTVGFSSNEFGAVTVQVATKNFNTYPTYVNGEKVGNGHAYAYVSVPVESLEALRDQLNKTIKAAKIKLGKAKAKDDRLAEETRREDEDIARAKARKAALARIPAGDLS